MTRLGLGATIFLLPCMALAAEVRDCDTPQANAANLAVPYDEAIRVFDGGDVGFINLFEEDAPQQGAHLMVLYPSPEGPEQLCALISDTGSDGFAYVAIALGDAVEDTETQLRYDVPVGLSTDAGVQDGTLSVRIDRASGEVAVAVMSE